MSDIAVTEVNSTADSDDDVSLRQLLAGIRTPTWIAAAVALAAAGYALRLSLMHPNFSS